MKEYALFTKEDLQDLIIKFYQSKGREIKDFYWTIHKASDQRDSDNIELKCEFRSENFEKAKTDPCLLKRDISMSDGREPWVPVPRQFSDNS